MLSNNDNQNNQRLIVALAASLGVLLLWQVFFAPEPAKKAPVAQAPAVTQPTAGAPAGAAAPAAAVSQAKPAQPTTPAPAKPAPADVLVETPLIKAWFSQTGGSLVKLVLKQYYNKPPSGFGTGVEDRGGNFVMVDLTNSPYRTMALSLENTDEGLEQRQFQASTKNLVLHQGGGPRELSFTTKTGDLLVSKTYTFNPESYAFGFKITVVNQGQAPQLVKPVISLRQYSNRFTDNAYADKGLLYYRASGGTFGGKLSEEDPGDLAKIYESMMQDKIKARSAQLLGQYQAQNAERLKKGEKPLEGDQADRADKLAPILVAEETKGRILERRVAESNNYSWAAMSTTYFMGAVAPAVAEGQTPPQTTIFAGAGLVGGSKDNPLYLYSASLADGAANLAPGARKELRFVGFHGPRDLKVLKPAGHHFDKSLDFGFFDVIAKPALWLMNWLYSVVGNYGVAIFILTLLIKIILWPLTRKSYQSMKKMQKLQPLMTKIREQYKGDPRRMQQETMSLYKAHGANPLGGCLPMALQMPVLLALLNMLGSAVELRHAPFLLWMNDLSAPDRLFPDLGLPWVGGIPVLTLLMGASMFYQQKLTPTTGDPTQAKMMMMMPIVFTFLFINFPSGLVLYWLIQNILSIGQQVYTYKKAD